MLVPPTLLPGEAAQSCELGVAVDVPPLLATAQYAAPSPVFDGYFAAQPVWRYAARSQGRPRYARRPPIRWADLAGCRGRR